MKSEQKGINGRKPLLTKKNRMQSAYSTQNILIFSKTLGKEILLNSEEKIGNFLNSVSLQLSN